MRLVIIESDLEAARQRLQRGIRKDVRSGCWEWQKTRGKDGYGRIYLRWLGRVESTHRASWVLYRGPIPEGFFVLHRCDNRACANPDHLWVGTHPRARLSNDEAREIRRRVLAGERQVDLAREFGVDRQCVNRIKKGVGYAVGLY